MDTKTQERKDNIEHNVSDTCIPSTRVDLTDENKLTIDIPKFENPDVVEPLKEFLEIISQDIHSILKDIDTEDVANKKIKLYHTDPILRDEDFQKMLREIYQVKDVCISIGCNYSFLQFGAHHDKLLDAETNLGIFKKEQELINKKIQDQELQIIKLKKRKRI
jgi:hypothetical protein